MGVIRTFVAIRLPGEIEESLGKLEEEMQPLWPERGVRWVQAENIHLTLRFLGDMEEGKVGEIGEGLDEVADGYEVFSLALANSGCFPNERRPRVIWTGVEDGGGKLGELQRDVEALVQKLGWEAEGRDYRPHLTLGRVRQGVRPPKESWLKDPPGLEFRVGAIELIESVLQLGGAEYRTQHRAGFYSHSDNR